MALSFALWFYEHDFNHSLPIHDDLDVWIAYLGGVMMVVFVITSVFSRFMGGTAKWRRKYRCIRCGAKIKKNEMYCEKHKNEIADQYLHGRNPEHAGR